MAVRVDGDADAYVSVVTAATEKGRIHQRLCARLRQIKLRDKRLTDGGIGCLKRARGYWKVARSRIADDVDKSRWIERNSPCLVTVRIRAGPAEIAGIQERLSSRLEGIDLRNKCIRGGAIEGRLVGAGSGRKRRG